MAMTPDAKAPLSKTIRALRERLLRDLHAETEAAYRLSIRARDAGLDEATRVRRGAARGVDRRAAPRPGRRRHEGERAAHGRGLPPRGREAGRLHAAEPPRHPAPDGSAGPSGKPLGSRPSSPAAGRAGATSDFRQLAPALVRGDETEGYAFLLRPRLRGPGDRPARALRPRRASPT